MAHCAIILAGSGVNDGSEIHEATLAYYFCDKNNITVSFFAPDCNQTDVINHSNGSLMNETRNCLIESARIARGNIEPLSQADTDNIDFALFPGGFGAAKTLSNFATTKTNITINEDVKTFILNMHNEKKPQGFMCITPVIAATLFPGVITTLGIEQEQLNILENLGAQARQATASDVVIDQTHHIYSTPAYMIPTEISNIGVGIEKLITTILATIKKD